MLSGTILDGATPANATIDKTHAFLSAGNRSPLNDGMIKKIPYALSRWFEAFARPCCCGDHHVGPVTKMLGERMCIVSKRSFDIPIFFNYAIADGLYKLLFTDKTGFIKTVKPKQSSSSASASWSEQRHLKLKKFQ